MTRKDRHQDFMDRVTAGPLMSAEKELEVIRAWKRDPRREYVDALLRAHVKLIIREVNHHRVRTTETADLFQEGCLGLMRSLHNFDPDKGFRLMTYGVWWVRVYMANHVLRTASVVWHGVRTTPVPDVRIRAPGEDLTAGGLDLDFIGHDDASPEYQALRLEELDAVTEALATLSPRDQEILGERLVGDTTLSSLGVRFGVSRERVRQIEGQALTRVRKQLKAVGA